VAAVEIHEKFCGPVFMIWNVAPIHIEEIYDQEEDRDYDDFDPVVFQPQRFPGTDVCATLAKIAEYIGNLKPEHELLPKCISTDALKVKRALFRNIEVLSVI
jgi:hypothetical protein